VLRIGLYSHNKAHHSAITGFEKFSEIEKHKEIPTLIENLKKYCGHAILDDKSRAQV
jgi:hypothetical protein